MQASGLPRFGNLIARSRREALRIMAGGGPHMGYRLGLIGERLIAAFNEIDAGTTRAQRLMLIGANPADARDIEPGGDSMLHLLWVHSLEWSAMRRSDDRNSLEDAPLYSCLCQVIVDLLRSDSVDAAFRYVLGTAND